ncbi:MAG: sigma-54-dependent transcriptional regulator [Gemmatimonadales bacterium]
MKERVLIVDDDRSIRETFTEHLGRSGFRVVAARSAEEALALLGQMDPGLVITDVRMPGMDGIEFLQRARSIASDVDVLVITAYEDMTTAVRAMKAGAYDFLVKPLDLDHIDLLVARCFRDRALRLRVKHLSQEASEGHQLESLVGRDSAMVEIYKLIGVLAENRATVLIRGETGTGKERIARAIHFNSPNAVEPFVAVNCTALAETLLESELFGHVRGAFTGAVASRKGYFELAGNGTVFLDEIGDMGRELQAKLLRVLERQEFYPVGAEQSRTTTARIIAATHRPLEDLVESGTFREDLYFRLKVVEIRVPALRDRRRDIPLLAQHLLRKIGARLHREIHGISADAMRRLGDYDWPGNVRELENALTRAAVMARGATIGAEHLALEAPVAGISATGSPETLDAVERNHVQRVLDWSDGNKRRAAKVLGISRPRLDRLIRRHELVVTTRERHGNES